MSESINKLYEVMLQEVNLKNISSVLSQLDENKINEIANGGVCGGGCDGADGKVCGLGCDGKGIGVIDSKGISKITEQDLESIRNQIPQLRKQLLEHLHPVIVEYKSDFDNIDRIRDFDFPRNPIGNNRPGNTDI